MAKSSRTRKKHILLLIVLATLSVSAIAQRATKPEFRSYVRARAVLERGIQAMGGLEALQRLTTVRRKLSGDWFGSGQHPRPYLIAAPSMAIPRSNSRTEVDSFIDYRRMRFLDVAREYDPVDTDSITRITAVAQNSGFETITYRGEKPFLSSYSADVAMSLRTRKLRRHPEGVLMMAWSRPETLEWVGDAIESGRPHLVISFADPLGTRLFLYFDTQTHLLTKSEYLREHAIAGDGSAETFFLEYRRVDDLRLPFHYIDRIAGIPSEEMRASSIELNVSADENSWQPPSTFALVEEDPSEPTTIKLGERLFLIRGSYNVLFAEFRDYVVVFEAPLSSRYAEKCRELISATLPGKPIRQLVSTHFHYDHLAGVRPYIAQGVSILTTPDAQGVIELIANSRRTFHPDALSRQPTKPRVEPVIGRRTLDDGFNRVELFDFGPTDHAVQILVAYFPNEKLLFEADIWDPICSSLAIAGSDTVRMARKIRDFGLQVERVIPVHGVPATDKDLSEALAVWAKYR